MEFFGVGPLELLVILVVIMIVVGPQRLPEVAAQLARFMRAFRQYSTRVTSEFNETLHELEQEYQEIKGDWKDVGQGLDASVRGAGAEIKAAGQDAHLLPQETKPAADGPPGAVSPSP